MVFTHATRVRVPDGEYFILVSFYFVEKKKNIACAGRESNPGLVRGRDVYYHYTTGANELSRFLIHTEARTRDLSRVRRAS